MSSLTNGLGNGINSAAQLVHIGLAVKGLCDLRKENPAKIEEIEEASLLDKMNFKPEEIRSSSPTTCEKTKKIGARLMLKHSLHAPPETTLRLLETYRETVAQCGSECRREPLNIKQMPAEKQRNIQPRFLEPVQNL